MNMLYVVYVYCIAAWVLVPSPDITFVKAEQ